MTELIVGVCAADGACGNAACRASLALASCTGTALSTSTLSRCSAYEVDIVQFSMSNEEEKKIKGRSDESTAEITSGQ